MCQLLQERELVYANRETVYVDRNLARVGKETGSVERWFGLVLI